MARTKTYAPEEKATVYQILMVNQGNIKKTSRETGVPETTIRTWKRQWGESGVSEEIVELASEGASNFINNAVRIRDTALLKLEDGLDDVRPKELAVIVGILDDKIARARGLTARETKHKIELPSPDDIRNTLAAALSATFEAADRRSQVIDNVIDAEPARKALPQSTA